MEKTEFTKRICDELANTLGIALAMATDCHHTFSLRTLRCQDCAMSA